MGRWTIIAALLYLGCAARLPRGQFDPADARSQQHLARELGTRTAYVRFDAGGRVYIRYFGLVTKTKTETRCQIELPNELRTFKVAAEKDCYLDMELRRLPETR